MYKTVAAHSGSLRKVSSSSLVTGKSLDFYFDRFCTPNSPTVDIKLRNIDLQSIARFVNRNKGHDQFLPFVEGVLRLCGKEKYSSLCESLIGVLFLNGIKLSGPPPALVVGHVHNFFILAEDQAVVPLFVKQCCSVYRNNTDFVYSVLDVISRRSDANSDWVRSLFVDVDALKATLKDYCILRCDMNLIKRCDTYFDFAKGGSDADFLLQLRGPLLVQYADSKPKGYFLSFPEVYKLIFSELLTGTHLMDTVSTFATQAKSKHLFVNDRDILDAFAHGFLGLVSRQSPIANVQRFMSLGILFVDFPTLESKSHAFGGSGKLTIDQEVNAVILTPFYRQLKDFFREIQMTSSSLSPTADVVSYIKSIELEFKI